MASSKPGVRRIGYAELQRRALAGDLTKQEMEAYFAIDEKSGTAFQPRMMLNRRMVDLDGQRPSRAAVDDLVAAAVEERKNKISRRRDIQRSRSRLPASVRKTLEAAMASATVKTKVLAEGDSWFDLPDFGLFGYPKDAMDFLDETHDLENLAKWKATLEGMLAAKQYKQQLGAGTYGFFFFSGGGNDVLNSIKMYVEKRHPGDTNPANASTYVNQKFKDKIKDLIAKYRKVIKDVKAIPAAANVVMFIHGYANAIPVKNKASLGKPLQDLGFDPETVGPLARAIVAHMVGLFNNALRDLAASQSRVVYVDLRDVVKTTDWHVDEIHPNASGARKISMEFAKRIADNMHLA